MTSPAWAGVGEDRWVGTEGHSSGDRPCVASAFRSGHSVRSLSHLMYLLT